MYRIKLEALAAIAAWAFAAASSPASGCKYLDGLCPRDADLEALGAKLSSTAKVYYPGSSGFTNITTRWSVLEAPKVNIVVVPGTENDVAETVSPQFIELAPYACSKCRLLIVNPGEIRKQEATPLPCIQWSPWCSHLSGQDGSRRGYLHEPAEQC